MGGFGIVYENVSVYDPYWSVAPPVMFTAFAMYKGCWTLPVVLLLIAVWYWGIRLTYNWAVTFKGLVHEDWRYTKYREAQSPIVFRLTNFFGLNMMPTLVVFACMLPGFGLSGLDWLVLGPVAMTALFLFISIPLMESRQLANKPAYAAYRSRTRILI